MSRRCPSFSDCQWIRIGVCSGENLVAVWFSRSIVNLVTLLLVEICPMTLYSVAVLVIIDS